MIDKTEEQFLCVIKNFNFPAVNGNRYNLDAECSRSAIQKFLQKKEVFGELNHPNSLELNNEQFTKRIFEIDMENTVIHISDLNYDDDKKEIIGLVKKVGNKFPDLFEKLQSKEVAFGMRSLCHAYKPSEDSPVIHDIVDIITFDIINTNIPE